jgi:hypothetical protein
MCIGNVERVYRDSMTLRYNNLTTNLNDLWDKQLPEQQGQNYELIAKQLDHFSNKHCKKLQRDSLIVWLWESYSLSNRLLMEVDTMKSRNLDSNYSLVHLPIIQQRIEEAGVRLAGVLNRIWP